MSHCTAWPPIQCILVKDTMGKNQGAFPEIKKKREGGHKYRLSTSLFLFGEQSQMLHWGAQLSAAAVKSGGGGVGLPLLIQLDCCFQPILMADVSPGWGIIRRKHSSGWRFVLGPWKAHALLLISSPLLPPPKPLLLRDTKKCLTILGLAIQSFVSYSKHGDI